MNLPKENSATDKNSQPKFVFVTRDGDDSKKTCIKLVDGPFKDTIYYYGKVGFAGKENKAGEMPLRFDYTITKNPNDYDLLDNPDFIDYIGDILVEIMEKQLKDGTVVYE